MLNDNSYRNGDVGDIVGDRDIVGDFPELYEKLKKDEFGYRKGMICIRFTLQTKATL